MDPCLSILHLLRKKEKWLVGQGRTGVRLVPFSALVLVSVPLWLVFTL